MSRQLMLTWIGMFLAAGLLAACGGSAASEDGQEGETGQAELPKGEAGDAATDAEAAGATDGAAAPRTYSNGKAYPDANWAIKPYEDPYAVIELAGGGTIVIELEKELAPKTVENFIRLAEQKFYDGTVFHRVIPEFMAQGGSPEGKGQGGPGWSIDLEVHPELRHQRASVAMAHSRSPNSAGSQFYICYQAKPQLDDKYAVFGKVIEGMDLVDKFPYGSTIPAESLKHGWETPGEGYPAAIETLRIVDGKP